MKKYKALSRIFVLSYFTWLFGAILFGLLLFKNGGALPYVILGVAVIDLAAIIVARCMFKSHYTVFLILSIIGFGILNVFCVGALVTEIIFTNQGIPAPYAWAIAIINVIFCIIIDIFYIRSLRKIHHKRLVEEGIIKEEEEEI